MSTAEIHAYFVWAEFALAAVTFVALVFITAPYGRHTRAGWGPTIPSRAGWIIMESPAVVVYIAIFVCGEHRGELVPLVLLGLWQTHYLHRTLIYPWRIRGARRMPVLIALLAVFFNLLNAYVNARFISHIGSYAPDWLADPRFILGTLLFFTGMGINLWADTVLMSLRADKERQGGYRIPRGGLYQRISCPNYLGECIEWLGWAVATWSLAGLAFAVYTAANLVPRALDNHRWYRDRFSDYPTERKALIPYLL